MRIRYNAPVTLTYALAATAVMALDSTLLPGLTERYFTVGAAMSVTSVVDYLRLATHALGHASWEHLLGNFAFILLLGPILEEKYGSGSLLSMITITAVATGLLNVVFLTTGLLGASGVVFMMILLVSFTNIQGGEIPLTFILVLVLYLVREIVESLRVDSVSQFAHIVGGVMGSAFGFFGPSRRRRA